MLTRRPFYTFAPEQDAVWRILFERQYPRAEHRACEFWRDGFHKLGLTADSIPNFAALNPIFNKATGGWDLVSTDVQYSDGQTWFEHLVRKEFLITEYIRDEASLDYTPLPDIYHDAFGHLPLMANEAYADLVHRYAQLMLNCRLQDRKPLGSIWWYTIEFGIIKEGGELLAFGAGLMSSYAELDIAFSDQVQRLPFDPATIGPVAPSPHHIHKLLWILEDFAQLQEFVEGECRKIGI